MTPGPTIFEGVEICFLDQHTERTRRIGHPTEAATPDVLSLLGGDVCSVVCVASTVLLVLSSQLRPRTTNGLTQLFFGSLPAWDDNPFHLVSKNGTLQRTSTWNEMACAKDRCFLTILKSHMMSSWWHFWVEPIWGNGNPLARGGSRQAFRRCLARIPHHGHGCLPNPRDPTPKCFWYPAYTWP